MRQFFSIPFLVCLVVGFVGAVAFPHEGAAVQLITQADCGSTFPDNHQTFLLVKNITCGGGSTQALEFSGDHVKVLLLGHTVSCDDVDTGIVLSGTSSVLQGPGTVEKCENGIVLNGGGRHNVSKVKSRNNGTDGFLILSSKNLLTSNTAIENEDDGFQGEGELNIFLFNQSRHNEDDGFDDDDGTRNHYSFNSAIQNDGSGFQLVGSQEARFAHNIAKKNGFAGFHLISADNCTVVKNIANDNVDVQSPPAGNGIRVDDNSMQNTIKGNTMQDNEGFDAEDENVDCDANKWRANKFTTSQVAGGPNPGCIR